MQTCTCYLMTLSWHVASASAIALKLTCKSTIQPQSLRRFQIMYTYCPAVAAALDNTFGNKYQKSPTHKSSCFSGHKMVKCPTRPKPTPCRKTTGRVWDNCCAASPTAGAGCGLGLSLLLRGPTVGCLTQYEKPCREPGKAHTCNRCPFWRKASALQLCLDTGIPQLLLMIISNGSHDC